MAFAGPPWTDRSAWRSPTRPVRRIRTRPATGSLKIAVVTLRPLHSTVFGRETFTETTRMASGVRDSAPRALGTHQDFPVDELPEGRVDPRLHLGFLPVLPKPTGPEGVLRPLQPARPIVVGQDAALSHVVAMGTKEHHVEGEGHLGAKVGDRGIVVEYPDELGLLHRIGEIFMEKPEFVRILNDDAAVSNFGAEVAFAFYVMFFCSHAYHMRQRGILS